MSHQYRNETIERAIHQLRSATCTYSEFKALNPNADKWDYIVAICKMNGVTSCAVRRCMGIVVDNDPSYIAR